MIGFLVGLRAEAKLLRPLGSAVAVGGVTRQGTRDAADRLIRAGARQLVSFGLAAGLDPAARAGDLLVPSRIEAFGRTYLPDLPLCARLGGVTAGGLLHSEVVVSGAAEKQALHAASLCAALDMESGILARAAGKAGLPFAALRAICDPVGLDLPPAATASLGPDGRIAPLATLASLLHQPFQVAALIALARNAARARSALAGRVALIGSRRSEDDSHC